MSKRKSSQFHQLAGSFRPDHHVKSRLQYAPASGTAPRHLSKAAKAEWRRVAPMLLDQGLLMETDLSILAAYCTAFAGYLECKALVGEQGQIITVESQTRTGRTSKPIRNPAVTLMLDYQRAMLTAASKFGFSPYDRERIEGSIDAPDDSEQPMQPSCTLAPSKPSAPKNAIHGDALGAFIKFPTAEADTDEQDI